MRTCNLISTSFIIKELDLSRNQLRGFNDELVEKLLMIESVKFDQNPFICDECNMAAILKHQREVFYEYLCIDVDNFYIFGPYYR